MHASIKTTRTLSALALAALLAACGGGGGGSSTPAAPAAPATPSTPAAPPADIVASTGNLQAASSDTYAANSTAKQAFDAISTIRFNAGAGHLTQIAALDTAASAHASYLTANIVTMTTDLHTEESNRTGFYEVSPATRIAKAGYAAGLTSEIVGGSGPSLSGAGCAYGLANTVYHAAALLSPYTKIGIGIGQDAATAPLCTINFATAAGDTIGQVPASHYFVQYPHPGQLYVLETFYVGYEEPRPSAALFPNNTAGTPVLVSMVNADWVNFKNAGTLHAVVSRFVLKDSNGNVVPAHILAGPNVSSSGVTLNADNLLPEGFVVLVPQSPLAKNVFYHVEFTATLKDGTAATEKAWWFATAI